MTDRPILVRRPLASLLPESGRRIVVVPANVRLTPDLVNTTTESPKAPFVITSRKSGGHDAATEKLAGRFSSLLADPSDIAQAISDADLDYTVAMQVESRVDDLVDWAPNVVSWCADPRFLGIPPFGKQAEMLLLLFEDYCPFCTDLEYLADIPVEDSIAKITTKVALLEDGECGFCRRTRADARAAGLFHDPIEIIAVCGQRSGKSAVIAMATSYLIHRNLRLHTPWKSYGLTPGQMLDFTVVATTAGQAKGSLWSTIHGMFSNSQWVKSYKEVCDSRADEYGVDELVVLKDTYIKFAHKHLLAYFAANNPASLRGMTRFGAAIDELGWFEGEEGSNRVRANGPETYSALNNALMTLRRTVDREIARDGKCNLPLPLMMNISSPRAMDDPIMTKYRERAADERTIRKHLPTWKMNPLYTKASLSRELSSPNGLRDFGAQPPITDNPLIDRLDIVEDAMRTPLSVDEKFGGLLRPTLVGVVDELDVPAGGSTIPYLTARIHEPSAAEAMKQERVKIDALARLSEEDLATLGLQRPLFEDLRANPPRGRPHIVGIDMGVSNNSFAIVAGYLAAGGKKFVTDFAIELMPTGERGINVADIYENFLLPLIKTLNVKAVVYDRWNSLHQIQDLTLKFGGVSPYATTAEKRKYATDLEKKKLSPSFVAEQYSLTVSDARNLVSRLEQGDALFPPNEMDVMEMIVNPALDKSEYPYTHLALQMVTVRAKGARLLKPVNGEDDLFRAWANAAISAFTNQTVTDLLLSSSNKSVVGKMKNALYRGFTILRKAGGQTQRIDSASSTGVGGGGGSRSFSDTSGGKATTVLRKASTGKSSSGQGSGNRQ